MNIVVAPTFERDLKRLVKKYPSLRSEFPDLVESLMEDPLQGIPLGKDCFKIRLRIASKGRGKSGGGRVITCVKILDDKVYLLTLYDKSEQSSIDEQRLDALLEIAGLF
ncbi:MAG: type II toxin-antitoxin system RelE/ParE family toxin [Saprospiraceae bacterium]|nr:type II toxin-antitoxin system RelE/ParE family toxin [Saprospiraceae bacterium]